MDNKNKTDKRQDIIQNINKFYDSCTSINEEDEMNREILQSLARDNDPQSLLVVDAIINKIYSLGNLERGILKHQISSIISELWLALSSHQIYRGENDLLIECRESNADVLLEKIINNISDINIKNSKRKRATPMQGISTEIVTPYNKTTSAKTHKKDVDSIKERISLERKLKHLVSEYEKADKNLCKLFHSKGLPSLDNNAINSMQSDYTKRKAEYAKRLQKTYFEFVEARQKSHKSCDEQLLINYSFE